MARRFCLLGCTDEQLGRSFGISESGVKQWMIEHPSFMTSVRAGREDADANVAASLYHRANGYSHKAEKIAFDKEGNALRAEYVEHYPPDTASAIFWLKNRRRDLWRDAPAVVVNNQNNQLAVTNGDPVGTMQDYRRIVDSSDEL